MPVKKTRNFHQRSKVTESLWREKGQLWRLPDQTEHLLKKNIQTPKQKVESFWGVKQWLFTNRCSILQVEKRSDESRLGENQAKACKGY